MKALVTGATGFIGSHLVERLLATGHRVRALVRNWAKADQVQHWGAEAILGDVQDVDSLRAAARDADTVFHAAARVSDWGLWSEFEATTVQGTENMLRAAADAGVARFLHVSSAVVYDDRYSRRRRLVTEEAPHGDAGDRTFGHYAKAKVLAEEAAWRYHRDGALAVTVIRPAWVYGPRDETILPPLIGYLQSPFACWLGRGNPTVDPIYVGDVADCAIAAATQENGIGHAYNVAPDREIGVRDFLSSLCRAMGIRGPRFTMPRALLRLVAAVSEGWSRLLGSKRPPLLTAAALTALTEDLHHDIGKAKRELGWSPKVGVEEGARRTAAWLKQRAGAKAEAPIVLAARISVPPLTETDGECSRVPTRFSEFPSDVGASPAVLSRTPVEVEEPPAKPATPGAGE